MLLQFQKGSALLWRNTHRYLHIHTSSQYYLNCMKMLIYSLNLNTEGQQEEVRKCIHYFWDLMLAHSVFMSCLRKKKENTENSPKTLTTWKNPYSEVSEISIRLVYKKEDWQVTSLYSASTFPGTNTGYLQSLLSSREITQEELMAGNWSQTNSFGKQGVTFECWVKQYSEFSTSLLFSWRMPSENKHCTDRSSWAQFESTRVSSHTGDQIQWSSSFFWP